MGDLMTKEIVKVIPFSKSSSGNKGEQDTSKWIGRIAIFELSTGSRVQGKILAMNGEWLDTDTGAIRVNDIVHAKWVNEEEASIIRGGPLGTYNPYTLPRR